ncbi:MAG: chromate efflux transporter [Rectinemataceae bacterium]
MDRSANPGRPHGDGSKGHPGSAWEVLAAAARLGATSFGGPIAHLGYFHEEYVVRRKWLDEQKYADLVALCQMIPGPASSQLGIAIGMERAGALGGVAAWLGFTLPSAVALVAFALLAHGSDVAAAGWMHGLMVVAVAVVAQAVWTMSRTLASDPARISMAIAAAVVGLLLPSSLTQILLIGAGAVAGSLLFGVGLHDEPVDHGLQAPRGHAAALACLIAFALILVGLPVLRSLTHSQAIALVDSFYRSGSLVFGGGHVVLPLLRQEVVPPGWISDATFLSGYGAAQAVPGPLFTFAAYLGAVSGPAPNGIIGAAIALSAIYLPSFLLVAGLLPFYNFLRSRRAVRAALSGVNATVVGILLAALYTPVWTSAMKAPADFALALAAFLLLTVWKLRPWIIVLGAALVGEALALILG